MSWIRKPTELELELILLGFECVKALAALIFRDSIAAPDDGDDDDDEEEDLEKNLAGITAACDGEQRGGADNNTDSNGSSNRSNEKSSSSTTGPRGNDDTDTVIEVHGITCYCCYFPGQYDRYGIPTTTITTVISIFTYVEDDSSFDHYEDESAIVVSGTKDPDAAVVA
ncbi:hypothetical protein MN608_00714 [Microdochium nivale]|nr:hypothetical protein MN608_00714 [Microdochium nivale]